MSVKIFSIEKTVDPWLLRSLNIFLALFWFLWALCLGFPLYDLRSRSSCMTVLVVLTAILHTNVVRSLVILILKSQFHILISPSFRFYCTCLEDPPPATMKTFFDLYMKQVWHTLPFLFLSVKPFSLIFLKNRCILKSVGILFVLHLVSHYLLSWLVINLSLNFTASFASPLCVYLDFFVMICFHCKRIFLRIKYF